MSGRSNATDCGVLKQVEGLEVVADLFEVFNSEVNGARQWLEIVCDSAWSFQNGQDRLSDSSV